jgi:DNA modification methylase
MRSLKRLGIYDVLDRHPVHPFPARMAPNIVLEAMPQASLKKSYRILDPMMGSGTVIALARSKGHTAIGTDIDPLAVLIARVWVTPIARSEVRWHAARVLKRASEACVSMKLKDAYPSGADRHTKQFIRYWFDAKARRQLTSLAAAIAKVKVRAVRDLLWCGFSRLIIAKQAGASLAMDLAHSRPHKAFDKAPIEPMERFLSAVEYVLKNVISRSKKDRGPRAFVRLGDARKLAVASDSIDLVLTSPPYLNAIDYMRCSKFSLVWMGYGASELREIRRVSVGTEVGKRDASDNYVDKLLGQLRLKSRLTSRYLAILRQFIDDMHDSVEEVSRVLVPGGRAVYVVGENTVAGVYVRNAQIIRAIAKQVGLRFSCQSTRTLPRNRRYLPPPARNSRSAQLDARMRREVILTFNKPKLSRHS